MASACLLAAVPQATTERTALTFTDITSASGVQYRNHASKSGQKYLLESMFGGLALFDGDGDGWLDIYFVNGAVLKTEMHGGELPLKRSAAFSNKLYRNNRDGTFTDLTGKAGVAAEGYGMGVAIGDFDNDGHQDLSVTTWAGTYFSKSRGRDLCRRDCKGRSRRLGMVHRSRLYRLRM